MKEMVHIVPLGSCPKCGHRQFIVSEHVYTEYLTNPDGEVVDSDIIDWDAEGMCCNCKTIFEMYPTRDGFIPLTRLRKIMLEYTPHTKVLSYEEYMALPNPMEVN